MTNDVILNKAATIERGVKRVRHEYFADPDTLVATLTRQDADVLNIQRACEATLDMGQVVIRQKKLGFRRAAATCSHSWPKAAPSAPRWPRH